MAMIRLIRNDVRLHSTPGDGAISAQAAAKNLPLAGEVDIMLSLLDLLGYVVTEHPESEQLVSDGADNPVLLAVAARELKNTLKPRRRYVFRNRKADDLCHGFSLEVTSMDAVEGPLLLGWNIIDFSESSRVPLRTLRLRFILATDGEIEFLEPTTNPLHGSKVLNLALQGLLSYAAENMEFLLDS
jgi:hypothetical protein